MKKTFKRGDETIVIADEPVTAEGKTRVYPFCGTTGRVRWKRRKIVLLTEAVAELEAAGYIEQFPARAPDRMR